MPYISTINNQPYTIATNTENQQEISIDGHTLNIDWRQLTPLAADAKGKISAGGRYSLLIGGKSYEVYAREINKPDSSGSWFEIVLAGQRFEVQVEDERERTLTGSIKTARESGEAIVRAPMPGLVLGIPFEAGTKVERGQTVVVLEAMKMENDLASPISGTIKEIKVTKGQTVNQGDTLVVVLGE
ncbi:MAG TPA: biotin/lipoyl-containing protein [Ktedonobacteraceae bacterium]|nr:biotin/lipoyl-containing protein [Ktedonobacteraceae bacterium]